MSGRRGARQATKWFHEHGYGNAGATCGHLIPDHERALKLGWKGIYDSLDARYRGQSHETTIPYTAGEGWEQLERRFHDAHRERNGFARPGDPVGSS